MPGFKKNRIHFRQLAPSDSAYIARWLTVTLHQSPHWERHFLKLLLEEWENMGKLSRENSWMAMYGADRLFFLEITTGDEVFLTAPRGLLNNRIIALAAWRRVIIHLRNLGTLPRLRVTLDKSREVECDCLLELGFIETPPTEAEAPNGSQNHRIFVLSWLTPLTGGGGNPTPRKFRTFAA